MATMWKVRSSGAVATDCVSGRWAKYDGNGERTELPVGWRADREMPTADMLAAWDAEAPAKVAELLAAAASERTTAERMARIGAVAAKYDGICAASGRRYRRGAMIARHGRGWALAEYVGVSDQVMAARGAEIGRLMDRADSTL